MNETQQQVQQSVYNSGIIGSAISDNVNETKALAQVQAQGSQEQSAAVPVAAVQPLNSDDIALPQQNSNSADSTDYSSFFEMIASTLDAVNTNIENLSSVISDVIDTLFPTKTAQSRSATNPIEKISSTNQTQSDSGLGLLGSIAAGVGGASLLSTLFGGEDEPPPPNAPQTPPTNMAGSPPDAPKTPPTNAAGSPPGSLETPTTPSNESPPTSDGSTSAGSPSQPPVTPSPVLDSTGVNPSTVIAGASVSTFAANLFKPSPTSLLGRALPMANRLLLPAALGYEGYDRYTKRGQTPGEIATVMGAGLAGMWAGAAGGAKLGGAVGALAGPPGAAIGATIGGFVGGGLGSYGSEYVAETMTTGDKLNQESVEASQTNSEVNNITLPSEQVSQPAPTPPQQQSSSPGVGDVPGCDRSLPETLDCKF